MKAKFFEEYLKTKEILSWRKLRGHRTAGFKHLKLSKGKKLRLDLKAQGWRSDQPVKTEEVLLTA